VTVNSTTTMTEIASNITVNAGTTTRLLSAGADNVFTGALTGTGTIKVISDNGYFNWQGASSAFAGTYLQGEGLSAWIDGTGSESADYILDYSQTLNQNAILVLATYGDSATVKLGSLTGLTTTGTLENDGTGNAKFIVGNKVGAGASTTFRGTIVDNSGTLAIEKVGAGTLILTGQNTYTGGTTVTAGAIQIGDGGATGTAGNGNIGLAATARLVINRTGTFAIPGTIGGEGSVVNQGTGTVQLSASNSYSGGTLVNAGTVAALLPVGATGSPLGTGAVTLSGGQLSLQGVLKLGAPVAVAGYNQDVIFALSEASASAGTTASYDAAPGYVFYENGAAHNGGTGGLPSSGTIASAANANMTFQLAPYSGNNSLQLNNASGTVTFTTPTKLNVLSFLHSSGSGASGVNFTVHFTGTASTYSDSFTSPDWYDGTPFAISGISRIDRSSDAYDTNASNPRLYENDFSIPSEFLGKSIASIDFTTTGGTYFNLMGISGRQTDPSAVASYGNDVVVASDSSISVTGSLQQQLGKLSIGGQKLSLVGESGAKLMLGNATFTGTPVFDTDAGLTLQLGAVSGGSNGLVKQGAGTLTLAGAVAYGGPTTINAGTLVLNNGTTTTLTTITGAGNLIVAAGSNLNAASINVGALTIGGSGGSAAAVPEPGTLALLVFGVLAAAGLAWKRR
jgi:fibronectin-binding autotransporter adhesin